MKKPSLQQNIFRNFAVFLVVFLFIASLLSFYNQSPFHQSEEVDIATFVTQIKKGEVEQVTVEGEKLNITLGDGKKEFTRKETEESLTTLLKNFGVSTKQLEEVKIVVKDSTTSFFILSSILPFIIPFLLIGGLIWYMMRQVQGANNRALMFGQSRARELNPEKKRVNFKDVAGLKEAKTELEEIVEFLKNPKKFNALGARIPKGVLLVGVPGTGKTLLARAVAGEADVPFYHISGSEFVEMFVGVGASRVRDLFRKAKKTAPCIVFIDEIDAVGRQRGAGLGGSHDEREQTLNQILVEMDGFDNETNVIIIAATNRPDVLDPALLRPGRFDRRVVITLPDIKEREAILIVHAQGKPFASDVDLHVLAQRTPGFSGADLSNVLNEAAIFAARKNKKKIIMQDALESIEKVMLGPERRSHVMNEKEKKITAYHEAGHALVAHVLPDADPVRKVSIVSRGAAGGYTLKLPGEDKHFHSKAEFIADLAVMLAGHAAEKFIFNDVTTGASDDLRKATKLARKIVMEYGMSEAMSFRTYGEKEELIFLGREIGEQRDYSEETARMIDNEVSQFLNNSYSKAREIILKYKEKLENIAQTLLEKETLEQEAFEALMKA